MSCDLILLPSLMASRMLGLMTVKERGILGRHMLAGARDRPEDTSQWPALEGLVSAKEKGAAEETNSTHHHVHGGCFCLPKIFAEWGPDSWGSAKEVWRRVHMCRLSLEKCVSIHD